MANNTQLIAEAIDELQVSGEIELAEEVTQAHMEGNLLTFAEWKRKGFSVQKGQKAKFSCKLWKKLSQAELEKEKKRLEEKAKQEGKKPTKPKSFVMTTCHFFLPSQVEEVKKKVAI